MSDIEPTDDEFFELPEDTGFADDLEADRWRTKDIDSYVGTKTGDPLDIFNDDSILEFEEPEPEPAEPTEPAEKKPNRGPNEKNWLVYEEPPPPEPKPKKEPGKSGRPLGSRNKNLSPAQKAKIEAVTLMVGCGITQATIARLLGISLTLLKESYRKELDYGKDILTSRIANALIQKALDGNVAAMQFWLKARAGWKEPTQVELTGADGKPLVSGIEREQRLMAIMMQNPDLQAKMLKRRQDKLLELAPAIDITPEPEDLGDIF